MIESTIQPPDVKTNTPSIEKPITMGIASMSDLSSLVNEKVEELYGWTAESLAGPVKEDDYGVLWPKDTLQYFKEAWAYKNGGVCGHDKLYHMVNMIKLDLPTFQFTSRGYINSNALRVIKAFCEEDDLGVAGAASTGKTFPLAACILEDWKCAPHETLSFVCTTTLGASEDRIWGAIVKLWQSQIHKIGVYVSHKYVISWQKLSDNAEDRDYNSAIKALAFPRGEEGKKAVSTTRGRKQVRVRLVIDELPEMDLYVLDAAVNLESNLGLKVVGIGNPAKHLDAHGQMCKPSDPLGWKSVDKNTPEWRTRTGLCIFLNGEWSPNFEAPADEPIPFPRLTNRKTLAKMLKRCHNNPNALEYWRNAIGFWPETGTINTVLTEELIKQHLVTEKCVWKPGDRKRVCGFDTGFTFGGDACVANFFELGYTDKGKFVVSWLFQRTYILEATGVFEDMLAKQVVDDCIKHVIKPDCFGMDITGDGGKVMRAIIRYWSKVNREAADIVPISSMGKPSDRLVSNVDPRKCSEVFDRRVTEYWMMAREAVVTNTIYNFPMFSEDGSELHPITRQLCTREYEIRAKKFCLETKDEMKERTQGHSPDEADSFVYGLEMARRHGLTFYTDEEDKRNKINQFAVKFGQRVDRENEYSSDSWGEDEEDAA